MVALAGEGPAFAPWAGRGPKKSGGQFFFAGVIPRFSRIQLGTLLGILWVFFGTPGTVWDVQELWETG